MRRMIWMLAALSVLPLAAFSQLAPTPPMGWNSWDSYGLTITEAEFKQNVSWFNTHLKPYGWKYVVIDEGWYLAHPENAGTKGADQGYTLDANGRYTPAPGRFPSAASGAGLKALAAYAHSLGLKFGIHIIRGIPKEAVERNLPIADSSFHAADAADKADTCRWNPDNYGVKNNAAGQAYYDSIANLYAGWGIDFVKVDCISAPYKQGEIHMMSAALSKTGRPIVLSLSPGPTPLEDAADVTKQAQMWRISNDFWDVWSQQNNDPHGFPQNAVQQFLLVSQWEQFAGPGHWPDADMLPFGTLGPRPGWQQPRKSRLTADEQRTIFTLWSIARSPLVLGANLTQMDAATEALLTNREVIAVNQASTGNQALMHTPQSWIWTAKATSAKGEYVALFNVSNGPLDMEYTWQDLGLAAGKHTARDLWQHKDLGSSTGVKVKIAPHASVLYRVE
ncbi:MAG: glycoside hydrolase family 27 protein [Acidobacteria bacterium]|nr:glycoside hydrolase family 27 protein [Acidobacteriota bacterium]MBW4044630.1 glycoside hydrolase family 27 protein [Acidobacteriota bacterium]